MFRDLISWPISTARAVIELPRTVERSIREANDLMEVSRRQLEVMRRQADQALEQADRMNDLLSRVVKLTEPIERAQRGGEYVGEALKRAIFGAERAAVEAEEAAEDAIEAAEEMRGDSDEARARDSATRGMSEEPPVSSGAVEDTDAGLEENEAER